MTNTDAVEQTDVVDQRVDPMPSPRQDRAGSDAWSGPLFGILQRFGLLIALIVAIVIFGLLRPSSFATAQNLGSILTGSAALTLISLGIMLPLIVQQFDLSVGYVATFASLLTVGVLSRNDWPVWQAIALGLVASLVVGIVNGVLVSYAGLNSLVVTLGVGSALYGLSLLYSGGELISSNIAAEFKQLGQARPLGIPLAFLYALVAGLLIWYFLSYRPTGRRMYAVGGSETAAKLAGIRVRLLVLGAFVMSALLCGIGGIVQAARVGSSSADSMTSFLLPAFTAAFLGATAIRPGHYNVWGTFLAVYLVATGTTGMFMLGAPTYVEPVFNGLILLVAISLARLTMRHERRR